MSGEVTRWVGGWKAAAVFSINTPSHFFPEGVLAEKMMKAPMAAAAAAVGFFGRPLPLLLAQESNEPALPLGPLGEVDPNRLDLADAWACVGQSLQVGNAYM